MSGAPLGFIPEPITVRFDKLLPSHRMPQGLQGSRKFKQIRSSIETVGLIEPLTVGPVDRATGAHVLLDGHVRLQAMQELGLEEAMCLVATDDEAYTYNNRINRLSTIQEHLMIRRAVERGVTPERLAKALTLDVSHIMKKLNLLEGICAEAAGLLKDQRFSANIGAVIRKMKPTRQIECAELMVSNNNMTVSYATALLAATPASMLVEERKPRRIRGVTAEQMARMVRIPALVNDQSSVGNTSSSVHERRSSTGCSAGISTGGVAHATQTPTVGIPCAKLNASQTTERTSSRYLEQLGVWGKSPDEEPHGFLGSCNSLLRRHVHASS